MKHITCFVLLAILAIDPADASERKQITLSVNEMLGLSNALMALDGHDRVTKDGAREVIVKESYKFGPGFRLAVARNMTVLRHFIIDTQSVARSLGEDKQAIDKLGTEKHGIELIPIEELELKLDVNEIPPSVLSGLSPILESK